MYQGADFFELKGQTIDRENIERYLMDAIPDDEGVAGLHEQDICANTSGFILNGNYRILFPIVTSAEHTHLYQPQLFVFCESNARYYTKRANYRSYMFLYTHNGQGVLKYQDREYTLDQGDGFLIDCMQQHHYYTKDARWVHSDLHFVGGASDSMYREYLKWGSPLFHDEVSSGLQMILEKLVIEWNHIGPYRDLRVSDTIGSLLTYIMTQKAVPKNVGSRYDVVCRAARYLENHFTENITLSALSEKYAVSKYHLSHDFKAYFGTSPIRYLIRFRIEHAKYLLMNTDLPIQTIAFSVGIPDLNNFANHFRKYTGITPSEYRRQHCV